MPRRSPFGRASTTRSIHPIIEELRALPDFVRAFEPDGLAVSEFDSWGPTVKTLRTFIGSYHELLHLVGRGAPGVTDPDLRLPPGEVVTPERAGWRYLSFAVHELSQPMQVGAPDTETAIVGLGGGAFRVGQLELAGRASVWDGLPSAVYLPPGQVATVEPLDGPLTVAVASAPASGRATADAPVRIGPEDVRVEVRGAGNATRQINHIITPEFPADRLEVVEVFTPSGNWSSWPPHKHDTDDMPREAILEEVYHYRFRRADAWGVQRLYGGSVEGLWAVRDGETVIVRDGYHPFVATHGDDAYYLNALAGDVRTMACSFDPALDHVRAVVGFAGAGSARPPGALTSRRQGAAETSPRQIRGPHGSPRQVTLAMTTSPAPAAPLSPRTPLPADSGPDSAHRMPSAEVHATSGPGSRPLPLPTATRPPSTTEMAFAVASSPITSWRQVSPSVDSHANGVLLWASPLRPTATATSPRRVMSLTEPNESTDGEPGSVSRHVSPASSETQAAGAYPDGVDRLPTAMSRSPRTVSACTSELTRESESTRAHVWPSAVSDIHELKGKMPK